MTESAGTPAIEDPAVDQGPGAVGTTTVPAGSAAAAPVTGQNGEDLRDAGNTEDRDGAERSEGGPDGDAAGVHGVDSADTGDGGQEQGVDQDQVDAHDELVAEGDAAGDYLERLLDILDYDGDIDLDVEGERAVVSIIGQGDVEKLVGDHGQVLDALQELTRLAAGMETGQRSRLMLDIAGYRAKRRAELEELGRDTAEQVVSSGSPMKLGAMNPFERKVVHDAVATVDGATSSSEGEEPHRRVVVSPVA